VRGKLRVDAFYFLSKEDWQKSVSWHNALEDPGERSKPRPRPERLVPQSSTAYAVIPCHEAGCNAKCRKPPIVLPDETQVVPDIYFFNEKAIARGKAISNRLAGKSQACSEDVPPTN